MLFRQLLVAKLLKSAEGPNTINKFAKPAKTTAKKPQLKFKLRAPQISEDEEDEDEEKQINSLQVSSSSALSCSTSSIGVHTFKRIGAGEFSFRSRHIESRWPVANVLKRYFSVPFSKPHLFSIKVISLRALGFHRIITSLIFLISGIISKKL